MHPGRFPSRRLALSRPPRAEAEAANASAPAFFHAAPDSTPAPDAVEGPITPSRPARNMLYASIRTTAGGGVTSLSTANPFPARTTRGAAVPPSCICEGPKRANPNRPLAASLSTALSVRRTMEHLAAIHVTNAQLPFRSTYKTRNLRTVRPRTADVVPPVLFRIAGNGLGRRRV